MKLSNESFMLLTKVNSHMVPHPEEPKAFLKENYTRLLCIKTKQRAYKKLLEHFFSYEHADVAKLWRCNFKLFMLIGILLRVITPVEVYLYGSSPHEQLKHVVVF